MDARVRDAYVSLNEARAESDDYLVEIRLGEIETLRRLAAENGLVLDTSPPALLDLRDPTAVQSA